MSTSPVDSSTTSIQTLAAALTRRFDADGDGRLGADEFTTLLSRAMDPAGASTTANAGAVTTRPLANLGTAGAKAQINSILQAAPETPEGLTLALRDILQVMFGMRLGPTVAAAAGTAGAQNYQELVQGILSQYSYGPEGLRQAAPELEQHGIQLQRDSAGQYRGRLKLPDGRIVDVHAPNEGHDWWNNRTGRNWGWIDRGSNTDAGGWSF